MKEKPLTPIRAIRFHCLHCAGRPKDVKECQTTECCFFRYRMMENPARKGIGGRPSHNKHSKSLPKLEKRGEIRVDCQEMKSDMAPSVKPQEGANNKEITSVGKGNFKIKKTSKGFIIRLEQE